MTENKRFKVYKVIGSFHEWSIEDTVDDKIVFGSIIHKYEADRLCECLNSLADENKELKAKVDDKEVAVEVECEKLMQKVFDLIDEKIKYYRKQPILAVRISANCEHRKSCLHNHEVNVCNKAKENAYRELKKELQE